MVNDLFLVHQLHDQFSDMCVVHVGAVRADAFSNRRPGAVRHITLSTVCQHNLPTESLPGYTINMSFE